MPHFQAPARACQEVFVSTSSRKSICAKASSLAEWWHAAGLSQIRRAGQFRLEISMVGVQGVCPK